MPCGWSGHATVEGAPHADASGHKGLQNVDSQSHVEPGSALTCIDAMKLAETADPTGRRRAVVRFAARACVVALLFASDAPPADAGQGRMGGRAPRGGGFHAAQMNNRMMRQERMQNGSPRGPLAREAIPQPAPPVLERPPEPAPVDRGGRPGRLTPEERRALRQQINDAGRDIYRAP